MSNIMHSELTDQWFTPQDTIDFITECMGDIDLDVCSSEAANKIVKAKSIITIDSLSNEFTWLGASVYCNPPSGKYAYDECDPDYLARLVEKNHKGKTTLSQAFWLKLNEEFDGDYIQSFCYLAYSLEQLRHLPKAYNFDRCIVVIPFKRIKFVPGNGQKATSPTHANALIFRGVGLEKIEEAAIDYGTVLVGRDYGKFEW